MNLFVYSNFIKSFFGNNHKKHQANEILSKDKKSKIDFPFYKISIQIISLFIIIFITFIYLFKHQKSVMLLMVIFCLVHLLLEFGYIADIYTKPSLDKKYVLDQTNIFGMLMFFIAYSINDDYWMKIIMLHDLFAINYLSDLYQLFILSLAFSIYYLFIISIIPLIFGNLNDIIKHIEFRNLKTNKTKIEKILSLKNLSFYYPCLIYFSKNNIKRLKIIVLIVSFIFDLIINILRSILYLINFCFKVCILAFYKLCCYIKSIFSLFCSMRTEFYFSKFIRISIIVALFTTIYVANFQINLKLSESKNFFEFLAGTIIIPLFYDSLHRIKELSKK